MSGSPHRDLSGTVGGEARDTMDHNPRTWPKRTSPDWAWWSIRVLWRTMLAGLITVVVSWVGWLSVRPENFPAAFLVPSPEPLHVGSVWAESDILFPVYLANRSSRPIQIQQFEGSHVELGSESTSRTIPARATARFEVRVALLDLLDSRDEASQAEWDQPFEFGVRPITDGGRAPVPYRFSGTARRVVRGLPREIVLGSTDHAGFPAQPVQFDIEIHDLVDEIQVESSTSLILASLVPAVDRSSESDRRRILRIAPTLPSPGSRGRYEYFLRIVAKPRDDSRLVVICIPMTWHVLSKE